jgi:hypothetical protein
VPAVIDFLHFTSWYDFKEQQTAAAYKKDKQAITDLFCYISLMTMMVLLMLRES